MLVAELKPPQEFATELPPPQASDFMPEPLTGLGALAPGRKRAHAEAVAQGEGAYEQALAAHAQAERHRKEQLARAQSDHEQSVSRERERVRRQHADVDQMARDFAEGKRKAVADYFSGVLTVQRYPSGFPTGVKVAYLPPDRELRIDIDLPLVTAIPDLESAEYLSTKKELKYKKVAPAARNKLYQQVVAQMALRTLRCVFAVDREGLVLEAACNGYVDTIDTATGQDAHWCLVSVQVPRAEFERLDLARVDPMDCLAYLHAKISKTRRNTSRSSPSSSTHGTTSTTPRNSTQPPASTACRTSWTSTGTSSSSSSSSSVRRSPSSTRYAAPGHELTAASTWSR